jgi:hypothetical protein
MAGSKLEIKGVVKDKILVEVLSKWCWYSRFIG